jgi:NAD(P)-dependent dehydrogenase (short-subunit alcohol dehydrogenase family)
VVTVAGASSGTVLVAGGTGALGTAVVERIAASGRRVVTTWVVEQERDRARRQFAGHNVDLVHADLFDPDAVDGVVRDVPDLAAVVNLVGGYRAGQKVHESDPDDFDTMLRLNLRPGFLLARAAMPVLVANGGGAFVGVSARPAFEPFSGAAGYITAKAGVAAFIRALDVEYRRDGVRCNAIVPGTIDTPANRAAQPGADVSDWVTPADIANVVHFLVSPDSAPVTGAALPVFGTS